MQARSVYFLLAFAILFSLLTTSAEACRPHSEVCSEKDCNEFELGTTSMDFNKKNIIACLENNNGEKKWKSISGVSGGLYGICREGGPSFHNGKCLPGAMPITGVTVPIAPAFCASNKCQCPNGYKKIVTGEYAGYEGSRHWQFFFSCLKE